MQRIGILAWLLDALPSIQRQEEGIALLNAFSLHFEEDPVWEEHSTSLLQHCETLFADKRLEVQTSTLCALASRI